MEGLTDLFETLHGWVQGFANEVNAKIAGILSTERPASLEPVTDAQPPPVVDADGAVPGHLDIRQERDDDRPLCRRPSPSRHDDRRECICQTVREDRYDDRAPSRRPSPHGHENRRDGTCPACNRRERTR